jgi:glycosyltransferase domain-containing protein
MNYPLLERLTLVIFTFNRHKYLKRTLMYWSKYNIKLVILDGSNIEFKDPCLKSGNIKYIYGPKDLYQRILSSINHIETEFMIMGSDDEFYLPSGLISCINFLIKEATFSSCGGVALGFGKKEEKKFFGQERYPALKNLILDQDSATERIQKHFSNYVPAHFCSVIRSNIWKKICKHVFDKEFTFNAALELQVEFLVLVSGKTKIISELTWMRNMNENIPHRGTSPATTVSFTINDWWEDKRYKNEKKDFLFRMKNACEELSINENSKFKEDKIAQFFKLYINKLYLNKSPLRQILNLINPKVKKFIKSIFGLNKNLENKSIEDYARALENQGILVNYNDLDQITSILKKS